MKGARGGGGARAVALVMAVGAAALFAAPRAAAGDDHDEKAWAAAAWGEARLGDARKMYEAHLRRQSGDSDARRAAAELAEILGDAEGSLEHRRVLLEQDGDPWVAVDAAWLLRTRLDDDAGARAMIARGRELAAALSKGSRRERIEEALAAEERAITDDALHRARVRELLRRQDRMLTLVLAAWVVFGAVVVVAVRRGSRSPGEPGTGRTGEST